MADAKAKAALRELEGLDMLEHELHKSEAMVGLLESQRAALMLRLQQLTKSKTSDITLAEAKDVQNQITALMIRRTVHHKDQVRLWKRLAEEFPDIADKCAAVGVIEQEHLRSSVAKTKQVATMLSDSLRTELDRAQSTAPPPSDGPRMKRKQMTPAEIREYQRQRRGSQQQQQQQVA